MPGKLEYDAVVVGSGPNGLAAAITLARSGCSVLVLEARETVGGGLRSGEMTLPGFIHDIFSAVHPMAVASPFFRSLDLSSYGLEWVHSLVPLAHPLDDGTAVLLERSVEATAEALGSDSQSYRALMEPLTKDWDKLLDDILAPRHFPRHPITFVRFGTLAIHSIGHLARSQFKESRARALFTGIAAHSILPTNRPQGAAFGLVLGAAGHTVGWPVVKGGSQKIADAMTQYLIALGGEVRTGVEVRSLDELPGARVILLDVTPRQLAAIAANRLPASYRQRLLGYQYGPGVFKMDWVLEAPIPWKASDCLKAATVHVGGTSEEIAEAESDVWKSKHPERPLVLLTQPSLFDSTRTPDGRQVVWAYCHVPNGSASDMSERIESQIERFAPGFRDSILARSVMNPASMEEYNPNFVGGDIAGGIQNPLRVLVKPMGQWHAYATPMKGVYLCSSSMPPGAGVHGMCGYHAAQRALRELR
ncbi:MAG: NAD(P)/FAD-dependent oxidoreductase [Dehalococcoidales bacterium]|nr:MAG: NAD(P)/FAD-dependent oxidoreductase [Dehalococcoidales bacterium]